MFAGRITLIVSLILLYVHLQGIEAAQVIESLHLTDSHTFKERIMLRFVLRRGKPLISKPKASSTIIYSTVNQPSKLGTSLSKYGVNLSKYAADGKLDPG